MFATLPVTGHPVKRILSPMCQKAKVSRRAKAKRRKFPEEEEEEEEEEEKP